eukprot:COSAG02_NODE_1644_length_11524_cov_76.342232_7_plen_122_part_00
MPGLLCALSRAPAARAAAASRLSAAGLRDDQRGALRPWRVTAKACCWYRWYRGVACWSYSEYAVVVAQSCYWRRHWLVVCRCGGRLCQHTLAAVCDPCWLVSARVAAVAWALPDRPAGGGD